jgi:hypothetical protein
VTTAIVIAIRPAKMGSRTAAMSRRIASVHPSVDCTPKPWTSTGTPPLSHRNR